MDGFDSSHKIIVIGATNFAESLDPALIRSGWFDKTITLSTPDLQGRTKLINYYLSKIKHNGNLNIDSIAWRSIWMTGADLKNIINLAAIESVKQNWN